MLAFPLLVSFPLEAVPSQQSKDLICPFLPASHCPDSWLLCASEIWKKSGRFVGVSCDQTTTFWILAKMNWISHSKRHLPSLKRALMRSSINQQLANITINISDKMLCLKVHLFQQQKQNQIKILIKIWRRGLSWSSTQWKVPFLQIKPSLAVTLHCIVNEPFHFSMHSNTFNLSHVFEMIDAPLITFYDRLCCTTSNE